MMKKLFFLPLLFACSLQAQTIKVLTYNIRLDNPGDGPDRWEVRKAALAAEVLRHQPSVAGFQEVTK
ncbi:MAG: hypothetical protein JNJ57_19920, partial [Saprospiraceae bacterium]|nr:hypothetical protein [Saprospiraceae bacterium]